MDQPYAKLYVERIRALCKARGISVNKLAIMSDGKQSTLDNIMRGLTTNPRVKTLRKPAIAFNMTLSAFLDFAPLNNYSFEEDEPSSTIQTPNKQTSPHRLSAMG